MIFEVLHKKFSRWVPLMYRVHEKLYSFGGCFSLNVRYYFTDLIKECLPLHRVCATLRQKI